MQRDTRTESLAVLLIEAEALSAMEVSNNLFELGHLVTGVAITGQSALELAKERQPDLVVLATRLADASCGLSTLMSLRAMFGSIPAVILSDEMPVVGPEHHPFSICTTPYSAKALSSAVAEVLRAR